MKIGYTFHIVLGLNGRKDLIEFLVCFIYFVSKSSVVCSSFLPVTRDSLPFVYFTRDTNGVEWWTFQRSRVSSLFLGFTWDRERDSTPTSKLVDPSPVSDLKVLFHDLVALGLSLYGPPDFSQDFLRVHSKLVV